MKILSKLDEDIRLKKFSEKTRGTRQREALPRVSLETDRSRRRQRPVRAIIQRICMTYTILPEDDPHLP